MAQFWLPENEDAALYFNEPALSFPGKKPSIAIKPKNHRYAKSRIGFYYAGHPFEYLTKNQPYNLAGGAVPGTSGFVNGLALDFRGNPGDTVADIDLTETFGGNQHVTVHQCFQIGAATITETVSSAKKTRGLITQTQYLSGSYRISVTPAESDNSTYQYITGYDYKSGDWVILTYVYDGVAKTSKVFINGILKDTQSTTTGTYQSCNAWYRIGGLIGAGNSAGDTFTEGFHFIDLYHATWSDADVIEAHKNIYKALVEPINDTPFVITVAAAGGGTITADFLASAATIYEPTLTAGPATLTVDFLPSAATVYEPTLTSGSATLTADFIASSAVVYEPTLDAGPATLTADFLTSAAAIYEPTLVSSGAGITADFLASGSVVYEPTLTAGPATLTADFVTSGAAVYEPTLTGSATITVDFLASAATVYEPTLSPGPATLTVDFLTSASAVYQPTLAGGPATLTADFLASAAAIYEPTLFDPTQLWTTISPSSDSWTEIPKDSETWTEI